MMQNFLLDRYRVGLHTD